MLPDELKLNDARLRFRAESYEVIAVQFRVCNTGSVFGEMLYFSRKEFEDSSLMIDWSEIAIELNEQTDTAPTVVHTKLY